MWKNCLKVFLILSLVALLVAISFRNQLCEAVISKTTAKATGLAISIDNLNLDILGNTLYMQEIVLSNPSGFNKEALAKVEKIVIKYNLLGSLKGQLQLDEVKVKINELNIIRNKQGKSNISVLKEGAPQVNATSDTTQLKKETSFNQANKKSSRVRSPKFTIENLEVFLEKAVFTDYRAGIGQPAVIVFTSKEPFIFKNVSYLNLVVKSLSTEEGFESILENFSK